MSQTAKHRPILGCDIGNGFGYVSLLQQQAGDPLPLLPSKYQLSNLGMPTTAYVTPPDGAPIVVFQKGKAAEKRYQKYPKQLVHAVKTRLKEGNIALPEVEKPVPVAQLYGAIARDLVTLAEEELKNKGIDPIYDLVFTFPASFADDTAILEQMQQAIQAVELDGHPLRVLGRLPETAEALEEQNERDGQRLQELTARGQEADRRREQAAVDLEGARVREEKKRRLEQVGEELRLLAQREPELREQARRLERAEKASQLEAELALRHGPQRAALILNLNTREGQRRVIRGRKRLKLVGRPLHAPAPAQQQAVEIDAHLMHPARGRDEHGVDDVVAPVGADLPKRDLRAGEDDGLRQIFQHERQRRRRIGHRVRPVEDDEAVIRFIALRDRAAHLVPFAHGHVGRVEQRVEFHHVPLRHRVPVEIRDRAQQLAERAAAWDVTALARDHADRPARVDDADAAFFHAAFLLMFDRTFARGRNPAAAALK